MNYFIKTILCSLVAISAGQSTNYEATFPTSPPIPPPFSCCKFENNTICNSITNVYYWVSSNSAEHSTISNFDGNYAWSSSNGAYLEALVTDVTSITTFSFFYYLNSVDAELVISFRPVDGLVRYLPEVFYQSPSQWRNTSITCGTTCCGSDVQICDGYFTIELQRMSDGQAAIDNLERDNGCASPCCYFNNEYLCDFTSNTAWLYSAKTSYSGIPNPGTPFMFFQTSYSYDYRISDNITSPLMFINNDTIFEARVYVQLNGSIEYNKLSINFVNSANNESTELDYVKYSSNDWQVFQFPCSSKHGQCCGGEASCSGFIAIIAHVDAYGGSVTYAVDAIGILGQCESPLYDELNNFFI